MAQVGIVMGSDSDMPVMAKAAGISFNNLLETIIEESLSLKK